MTSPKPRPSNYRCKECGHVGVYVVASLLPEEPPPATPNTQEWLCLKCEQKYIGPLSDPRCPTCNSVAEEPPELKEALDVPQEKQFEWAVEMYRVAVSNAYWMRGDPSNCDKEAKEETARAALVALFERQRIDERRAYKELRRSSDRYDILVASLSSQLELARDSAAEYEAERNEAGARAKAAESSLVRLRSLSLTADEAERLLEGRAHELNELRPKLFAKLRRLSQSDTGDTKDG